ncbi:MAG: UDP-N-acetylmuramoyl-L-alanine--D-glutamate ligase [Melioribacteraceae bacterium]|nr:UDP-N-acetylmuramoyl-L-alanine--D-glutamate ligase [Melioribacteraceae bacterium]
MRNIKDKHITILGAVRSGIAAAKLAKKMGAIPFVSDYSNKLSNIQELDANEIKYELGGHTDKVFDCEFIVTSPGVHSDASVIVDAKKQDIKIISEIEFASWFCKGSIIAITGSNGKTTTTSLCTHLLNNSGVKAYSAGNIGNAFSEIALDVEEDEFVALEVSSFQLDFIDSFKPKYTVILNITPDHLDRYENDFQKYTASKMRIFENQTDSDYLIINEDDEYLSNREHQKIMKYGFSLTPMNNSGCYIKDENFVYRNEESEEIICSTNSLKVKGEHNKYNAMATINLAKIIGIENNKIEESLKSFAGVEHRLESVREINGIEFVNDSKATNVDSVWYALRSFNNPLRLILGGKDKGNDYSSIVEQVKNNVKKIYAIGSSAEKIISYFVSMVEVEKMETLEGTVLKAYQEANAGDVVLLSPACASFDMFDSYEHRGKIFKQSVMKLEE